MHTRIFNAPARTTHPTRDEYFSDGMTDELAHALSQLPGLRLTGRTSAFSFKGKSVSASDIGKALDVAGIIEGTVRRSGDRLRVTASLTSTSDGKRRWSDSYESSAKDVFTVQDELTKAMVTALAPALRGDPPAKVAEHMRGTNDAVAYDDYLKGRHFWELRGTVNLVRAVENFKRAIKRDPSFARAYAGLAMVYAVLPGYAGDPMDTLTTASVLAAKQALSLDSTLTDAKLALAYIHSVQGRTDSAEAGFAAVIAHEPQNVTARQWHGTNELGLGRFDEAIKELRYATSLDPLSAVVQSNLVYALFGAQQFDAATREAARVFDIEPDFIDPSLVASYLFGGQPDSALAHLARMQRVDSTALCIRGMLALTYAVAGRWSEYDRIVADVKRNPGTTGAVEVGIIAMAGGDYSPLSRLLATSAGQREWSVVFLANKCSPLLAPLRNISTVQAFVGTNCAATKWPIKPRGRR